MQTTNDTLATWIGAHAHRLVPIIVPPEEYQRVHGIASGLPPFDTVGLEIQLGAGSTTTDISVFTKPGDASLTALTEDPSSKLAINPAVWIRVQDCCTLLANGEWENSSIEGMWLEFSDVENPSLGFIPAVFLGSRIPHSASREDSTDRARDFRRMIGILSGDSAVRNLNAAIENVPIHLGVRQVGVFPTSPAVRVCLSGLTPNRIAEDMTAIGVCDQSAHNVLTTCQRYGHLADDFMLSFDFHAQVLPRIGLELSFRRPLWPPSTGPWRRLLHAMVGEGLCLESQAEFLLEWPGWTSILPTGQDATAPASLGLLSQWLRLRGRPVFLRSLSHLKLVCKPAEPVSVKAYFGFHRDWVVPKDENHTPHRSA